MTSVEDGGSSASDSDATETLIAELSARGLTVAVAESLTGGLLVAELIRPAGASAVVVGGVVAYATELKRSQLGVDEGLLASRGPVDPEVARQMAAGVRAALRVNGRTADIGISTTGVAGPDPQGGRPPGTVFLGLSTETEGRAVELQLSGDRLHIRTETVRAAVALIAEASARLERGRADN
ncbi:CinA family protein [Mycetocola zhadangensis]|uniref:CinA family protein n=1 Tax=Mycetocola zhadangensis TaxID=1164595 RepID=A0A3L7IT48_9MICO|nr:CinA family protein [Mycetocola zhadangensis]RLQ81290.1 CinA family protein [Mycetocola zhadangensis]GGF03038.1 competence damage-inducible protein A [Mycetocola zhadangensis]